jgi:hypothetical protein
MRTGIFYLLLMTCLLTGVTAQGQTRFFEFRTTCGGGHWQDTAFIVAASDPALISEVRAEMLKPYESRRFINGELDYGNAGYNHNAGHWFLWHIKPASWTLTDFAIELCDGCPYSDVDRDTATWIRTVKHFCPWTGRPSRELTDPTGITEQPLFPSLKIWPQPVLHTLQVNTGSDDPYRVELYDVTGKRLLTQDVQTGKLTLDMDLYAPGIYLLRIGNDRGTVQRTIQKQ